MEALRNTAKQICEAIPLMLAGKTDQAMNRFNAGKQKQKPAQKPAAVEQEAQE
jgi:hypothetical protein